MALLPRKTPSHMPLLVWYITSSEARAGDTAVFPREANSHVKLGANGIAQYEGAIKRSLKQGSQVARSINVKLSSILCYSSWGYLFVHLTTAMQYQRHTPPVMPALPLVSLSGGFAVTPPTRSSSLRSLRPIPFLAPHARYAPRFPKNAKTLNRDMLPVQPDDCNKGN
ncbi:hypothetical protein BR93DRAFT_718223 [Coniochaeta sp. PMI_546]|nr:hypothetical protein BR93DRAFT_718223 [Coniochaeta sp. PMI_546]